MARFLASHLSGTCPRCDRIRLNVCVAHSPLLSKLAVPRDQPLFDVAQNLRQRGFSFILNRRSAALPVQRDTRVSIHVLPADELMQVTVGPAHRHSQDRVQPTQVCSPLDVQPSADA